jgi:hypothetical protein
MCIRCEAIANRRRRLAYRAMLSYRYAPDDREVARRLAIIMKG